jgi:hypothetical protein
MNYPYYPIQPQQAMQNGGYIPVRSEEEAMRYPLAPGTFATFRIEGTPFIVEKSMGFSQIESPQYRKYQLVPVEDEKKEDKPEYASKDDLKTIEEHIAKIEEAVSALVVKEEE